MKYSTSKAKKSNGFTLLEMVIAMGLMAMLTGMIYRVAQSSIILSQTVIEQESATMEHHAFFNLLQNHFDRMPGDAVMRLNSTNGKRNRKLFSLVFQNMPMAFSWEEATKASEAVELVTVERQDGFIDLVLRYYDEKVIEDTTQSVNDDPKPAAEITLLKKLWLCECEVTDGRTLDQTIDWKNNRKLPLKVKFFVRFDANSDIVEQTYWIIPKQNPELYMRKIIANNPVRSQSREKKHSKNEILNDGKEINEGEDLEKRGHLDNKNWPVVPLVSSHIIEKGKSF